MRRVSSAMVVLLMCLSACVAHEKNGDKAAAVGDWKTALLAYREALMKEPESPALKEKYEQARREAVVAASQRARTCASAREWPCAVEEADFALSLDASNTELAAFRADAARELALELLQRARVTAGQRQFPEALGLLERATGVSNDPGIVQEAAQVRAEVLGLADVEAERLRQLKAYPRSLSLLRMLVSADPNRQLKLQAVEAEYDQHQVAEYERLAREGDEALAARRWAEAQAKYEDALRMRSGGRAEPLARFAEGLNQGDSGLARRDFALSADGYRQAVESGQDRDGYAAAQLARVEVRPYAVRIRSVRPAGRVVSKRLQALSVVVTLPDGERLTTPLRTGRRVSFDSELVIAANHFDERKVSFRVLQGEGASSQEVGVIHVTLGDLVSRAEAEVSSQSIAQLALSALPSVDKVDGMFTGMRPVSDGSNLAQDFSVPTPRTRSFRLTSVKALVRAGDYQDEGTDGAPDLYVELEQGGRVVYRGPFIQDRYDAAWTPRGVLLHVEEEEQLVVRLWDADDSDSDAVLSAYVPARSLASGSFQSGLETGTFVDLRFEPRWTESPRVSTTTRP